MEMLRDVSMGMKKREREKVKNEAGEERENDGAQV
jgi:hypothetical protein